MSASDKSRPAGRLVSLTWIVPTLLLAALTAASTHVLKSTPHLFLPNLLQCTLQNLLTHVCFPTIPKIITTNQSSHPSLSQSFLLFSLYLALLFHPSLIMSATITSPHVGL